MSHKLRNYVAEQKYVEPVITGGPGTEDQDLYHEIRKYPEGVVQPAVLCIKPDGSVLFSWHIIPAKVLYYRLIHNYRLQGFMCEGCNYIVFE